MARVTEFANEQTAPRWAGSFITPEYLLPGGGRLDPAAFFAENDVLVTLTAGAAADAVALAVQALTGPIPAGTKLYFGEAKEFALTTADAATGAVALAVQALPSALENGDIARYTPGSQPVSVPSGTLVGRTLAEAAANAPFGPAADADDEKFFTAFDVTDVTINPDVELLLPNKHFVVKTNYLPAFSGLSNALQTAIRSLWTATIGWN